MRRPSSDNCSKYGGTIAINYGNWPSELEEGPINVVLQDKRSHSPAASVPNIIMQDNEHLPERVSKHLNYIWRVSATLYS